VTFSALNRRLPGVSKTRQNKKRIGVRSTLLLNFNHTKSYLAVCEHSFYNWQLFTRREKEKWGLAMCLCCLLIGINNEPILFCALGRMASCDFIATAPQLPVFYANELSALVTMNIHKLL
jgi:hypothetical protein